jgi:CRP-like cAMP-binding protein
VVKAAIGEALANSSRALKTPLPDVILAAFDSSAINYRVRFWIEDYERDEAARDEVRTNIYYTFARQGIEIPWPIQIQYERAWEEADPHARTSERSRLLAGVDLFAGLDKEMLAELAQATSVRTYGNGEAIVRQGEPGESMFVVGAGRAAVVLEPDRREVAIIDPGGYFGEMSMLTGDLRTATVVARGDTRVFEISAELFRRLAASHPRAVEQVGVAAATRRIELDKMRAAVVGQAVADAPATFVDRMRRFLRLS